MEAFTQANGEAFLNALAALNPNGFEGRFSRTSSRLGLGDALSGVEIRLLCEAAYLAILCRIAFNGLGGCNGKIKPEREKNRIMLEQSFAAACGRLWVCPGWQRLAPAIKEATGKALLDPRIESKQLSC